MPLTPGARLGPYQILSLLGSGGMGQVYKALDTRLDRTVAIKTITPVRAADPTLGARFEREARAISRLTHPHICTLLDVGREGDVEFLVVEFLEGETLASRLAASAGRTPRTGSRRSALPTTPSGARLEHVRAARPLPLAETLRIGAELAEGLAAAHKAGIIHRDLKPGNVMLSRSGVKILDFGVARLEAAVPAAAAATTHRLDPITGPGSTVGTLPYMSPEQVEGKDADARSDLFALGVVLYEMATGRRPFQADSAAGLAAAIVEGEPVPITTLQPSLPPGFAHVVSRCLAKDPEARWQHAADVAHELRWIAGAGPASSSSDVTVRATRVRRYWSAWIVLVALLATLLVGAGFDLARRLSSPTPAEPSVVRLSLPAPPGLRIVTDMTTIAISPDGRQVVLAMVDDAGVQRLWTRRLDSLTARPLPGSENGTFPFWSPDASFVAFFAGGKLWKVATEGGAPELICSAPNGRGGSWSRDGVIIFAARPVGAVLRVSAAGGEPVEVARPAAGHANSGFRFPQFLPDGTHFLYVSVPRRGDTFDTYIGSLQGTPPRLLLSASSEPVYAEPGFLLFTRANGLVAQRFDLERLQLAGDVLPLPSAGIAASDFDGAPRVSVSANGVLVQGTPPPKVRLVWLDRAGRVVDTVPIPPDDYSSPYLSPDARLAVVAKRTSEGRADLWLVDLERALPRRLTSDGLAGALFTAGDINLAWSPRGDEIAYVCDYAATCTVSVNGPAQPVRLSEARDAFEYPAGWSADGRSLLVSKLEEGTQYDLRLLPLHGERKLLPFLRTPYDENIAAVSPNGRWIAYDSNEAGRPDIYVTSFPEPGEKQRISAAGGYRAQWSPDGRRLYVWTSAGSIDHASGPVYEVDVQAGTSFKAGTLRKLFTPAPNVFGMSATRDVQRFLAAVAVEGWTPTVDVTLNWRAGRK
jgi:serine/threonine protein kinase/Tol biopolymer transport system component